MSKSARINKIYRTPPTPPIDELIKREKSFILDCRAVSCLSNEYSNANPKYGSVIPVYVSADDKHTRGYYKTIQVPKIISEKDPEIIIPRIPRYLERELIWQKNGLGGKYLQLRNIYGCGRTPEMYSGHFSLPILNSMSIDPRIGKLKDKDGNYKVDRGLRISYTGEYGYRRTTPNLRLKPSSFGEVTQSPLYDTVRGEVKTERNGMYDRQKDWKWESIESHRSCVIPSHTKTFNKKLKEERKKSIEC